MACGEASVCPDASLGRRVIGRPSRWLAGATPLLSVRLDVPLGMLEPRSLATAGADARGMERGRLGAASHGLSVGEVGVCAVVEYACVHDPPRNYGLLGSVTCVGRGRVPVGPLILWASLAVPVSAHPPTGRAV